MIKEITTYIANNVSELTLETNLFGGFRPDNSPDRCIAVLENAGGSVNSYFPDAGDKLIQILSRAPSFWDARDDIYLVFDLLKSKSQIILPVVDGGATYNAQFIEAQDFPQSLQQDERGNWEFSSNFVFRMKEETV